MSGIRPKWITILVIIYLLLGLLSIDSIITEPNNLIEYFIFAVTFLPISYGLWYGKRWFYKPYYLYLWIQMLFVAGYLILNFMSTWDVDSVLLIGGVGNLYLVKYLNTPDVKAFFGITSNK